MKKHIFLLFVYFSISLFPQNNMNELLEKTDLFLIKYVNKGRVNYSELKNNRDLLYEIMIIISETDVKTLTMNELKAFYINSYNLTVINSVVEKYPIKSPLKVDGFFNREKHLIAGEYMTLDEIQKTKLWNLDFDLRLHFVLVCAAKGCPVLENFAYTPSKLDEQLHNQTEKALNNSQFIKVRKKDKKVFVSEIFKWYQRDFDKSSGSVLKFINKYRKEKIPTDYKLDYYQYDWNLNEQ